MTDSEERVEPNIPRFIPSKRVNRSASEKWLSVECPEVERNWPGLEAGYARLLQRVVDCQLFRDTREATRLDELFR